MDKEPEDDSECCTQPVLMEHFLTDGEVNSVSEVQCVHHGETKLAFQWPTLGSTPHLCLKDNRDLFNSSLLPQHLHFHAVLSDRPSNNGI